MVLRDGDRSRYDGNGVRKAVEMAEKVVLPAIRGMDVLDQQALDRRLMELDGTPNKSRLGAMSRTARRWRSCGPDASCAMCPSTAI